jgi:CheY-like chemotaxis protein
MGRQAGELKGKRFLLVEDTPDHRTIFARLLRRAGAMVQAQENLPRPEEVYSYDCLLLDYMLKGQELETFLPTLRDGGRTPPLLVIFSVLPQFLLVPLVQKLVAQTGLQLYALTKNPSTFIEEVAALCASW